MIQWTRKSFNELTNEELYNVLRLRQEVFVVEQNCPYLDNDGLDLACEHIIGMMDGIIVLYARIIPKGLDYEDSWSIGRVLTRFEYRGRGLGMDLIQHCLESIGNDKVTIHAQSYLEAFYNKFGFESIGEEYDLDGIPHKEMRRLKSN